MVIWRRIKGSVGRITNIVKKIGSYGPKDIPQNVTKGNAPIGVPGGKIVSGAKSVYNAIKTFATRKTINPVAGVKGVKNVAKALGAVVGTGALAGGLFQGGRIVAKAGITGEVPKASDVSKSLSRGITVGAGIATSPLGGSLGLLEGGGIASAQTAKEQIQKLFGVGKSRIEDATNVFKGVGESIPQSFPTQNINVNIPNLPQQSMLDFGMPETPTNIIIQQPETPLSRGFDTSFSLGGGIGGGNEILPLLILAGLSGGAGFALGRRKRKKKKKKKYKKRRN